MINYAHQNCAKQYWHLERTTKVIAMPRDVHMALCRLWLEHILLPKHGCSAEADAMLVPSLSYLAKSRNWVTNYTAVQLSNEKSFLDQERLLQLATDKPITRSPSTILANFGNPRKGFNRAAV